MDVRAIQSGNTDMMCSSRMILPATTNSTGSVPIKGRTSEGKDNR